MTVSNFSKFQDGVVRCCFDLMQNDQIVKTNVKVKNRSFTMLQHIQNGSALKKHVHYKL